MYGGSAFAAQPAAPSQYGGAFAQQAYGQQQPVQQAQAYGQQAQGQSSLGNNLSGGYGASNTGSAPGASSGRWGDLM
jgi:hypothetical protein